MSETESKEENIVEAEEEKIEEAPTEEVSTEETTASEEEEVSAPETVPAAAEAEAAEGEEEIEVVEEKTYTISLRHVWVVTPREKSSSGSEGCERFRRSAYESR